MLHPAQKVSEKTYLTFSSPHMVQLCSVFQLVDLAHYA